MTTASRALANRAIQGALALGLLRPSYTTTWDATQHRLARTLLLGLPVETNRVHLEGSMSALSSIGGQGSNKEGFDLRPAGQMLPGSQRAFENYLPSNDQAVPPELGIVPHDNGTNLSPTNAGIVRSNRGTDLVSDTRVVGDDVQSFQAKIGPDGPVDIGVFQLPAGASMGRSGAPGSGSITGTVASDGPSSPANIGPDRPFDIAMLQLSSGASMGRTGAPDSGSISAVAYFDQATVSTYTTWADGLRQYALHAMPEMLENGTVRKLV